MGFISTSQNSYHFPLMPRVAIWWSRFLCLYITATPSRYQWRRKGKRKGSLIFRDFHLSLSSLSTFLFPQNLWERERKLTLDINGWLNHQRGNVNDPTGAFMTNFLLFCNSWTSFSMDNDIHQKSSTTFGTFCGNCHFVISIYFLLFR